MGTATAVDGVQLVIDEIANMEGAKFASFEYRARGTGELARYTVILGASIRRLYERDIAILTELGASETDPTKAEVIAELLASRQQSLANGIGNNENYRLADVYDSTEIPGIKIHRETGNCHVTALIRSKTVIEPGTYKERNRRPKTILKDEIRKLLPSEKIREFVLESANVVKLNGETIVL